MLLGSLRLSLIYHSAFLTVLRRFDGLLIHNSCTSILRPTWQPLWLDLTNHFMQSPPNTLTRIEVDAGTSLAKGFSIDKNKLMVCRPICW